MRISLLGPPGAGKGTQAQLLSENKGFERFSTGDILRQHISESTSLGDRVKDYLNRGELVPDDILLQLARDFLEEKNSSPILFDGFPRTLSQAEGLDRLLEEKGHPLDLVIFLDLEEAEIIKRLNSRRICKSCGANYNLITQPPKVPGKCDRCGGPLIKRDDDNPEVIKERLRAYKERTSPLYEYYKRRDILIKVSGTGSPLKVYKRIVKLL